jgi:hypothetical protein
MILCDLDSKTVSLLIQVHTHVPCMRVRPSKPTGVSKLLGADSGVNSQIHSYRPVSSKYAVVTPSESIQGKFRLFPVVYWRSFYG